MTNRYPGHRPDPHRRPIRRRRTRCGGALPLALAGLIAAAGASACGAEAGQDTSSVKPPRSSSQSGEQANSPSHTRDSAHSGHQAQGKPQPQSGSAQQQRPFTVAGTGDLLVHDSIIRQARADSGGNGYEFRRMLSDAKRTADSADLAICHMETVYGPRGGPFSGYPSFQTPPDLAQAVKDSGYDSCSTASNHSLDKGQAGISRTLGAMDKAGLKHTGTARNAAESRRPAWLRAGGAKVAHLSYTYGTNGIPKPTKWSVNSLDATRIRADARAARKAGADVVIVSPHWGTEFQQEPDALQQRLARQLSASPDIDLILGTHAHVPQAYEKQHGTWIVYGMGDQVAGVMDDPRGSMGSAARFTFTPPKKQDRQARWKVTRAEYLPTFADPQQGYRAVNLSRALAHGPKNAAQLEAQQTVRKAVLSRGAAKDGLREGR